MRILFILSLIFLIISCNQEHYYKGNDAEVGFSSDTISFDTVFTSIGTATQRLKIYNPYDGILSISNIRLASDHSPFILNINGVQTRTLDNVEIYPKDSLYIFIQVMVNPTGSDAPLFIRDSILFTMNDRKQDVKLIAYGQDVHLIRDDTLKTTTWKAGKPYLLFGNILVDTLQILTIEKGASVFFHKNANLIVKGTLSASGDRQNLVHFGGDRLEKEYSDIPGQWGSLLFMPGSSGNLMNWCIIENGTSGIYLNNYNNSSKIDLNISNTIVRNMSSSSLYAINSRIRAINCIIADAAGYTCALTDGGDYEFYHCSIANRYNNYLSRGISGICLKLSNYYFRSDKPDGKSVMVSNDLVNAGFYNSIIYAGNTDEIVIDSVKSAFMKYTFDHCLLKSRTYYGISNSSFKANIWNKDPKFKPEIKFAFQLDTLSPAKDAGDPAIGLKYPMDLKNDNRTLDKGPDIGAYERIEK